MSLLASIFDRVSAALPGKPALLRAGSRLPPAFKIPPVRRLLGAVARRVPSIDVPSNLGFDASLRWMVPSHHWVPAFGRPSDYRGERGCLELAAALQAHGAEAFIDIGAHLGYFTAYVGYKCTGKVPIHAFEPDPELFARLQSNIARNQLAGVTVHRAAMSDHRGVAVFHRNFSDSLSGSLVPMFGNSHRTEEIEVELTTLSDFIRESGYRSVCVKVDVEGAERLFFAGAKAVLDRVAGLIIEVLEPAARSGFVLDVIRESGWHAYYVNDLRLEHSPAGEFRYAPGEYNWFFTPRAPAELAQALSRTRLTVH